uniref:Uncharacterized protein n=1 Tax=Chromera velia CCMP2878 TaxID=1169474 RepID=A0A0G4HR58_9ALVE|eukprot:Cvel_8046.t1-p1 / transcript=Cvel_8046.t1 / gene=Cvel_8046 / organism=Chromera_velia_CCMP2878 / gene_product=hypothetical protein / transcript_product=hypothetical protein / location=Cvel_scaffold435:48104-49909(-) / protein_length=602 / sequence_SO=supercontig / SO=protein_coding / is_pseudo=false
MDWLTEEISAYRKRTGLDFYVGDLLQHLIVLRPPNPVQFCLEYFEDVVECRQTIKQNWSVTEATLQNRKATARVIHRVCCTLMEDLPSLQQSGVALLDLYDWLRPLFPDVPLSLLEEASLWSPTLHVQSFAPLSQQQQQQNDSEGGEVDLFCPSVLFDSVRFCVVFGEFVALLREIFRVPHSSCLPPVREGPERLRTGSIWQVQEISSVLGLHSEPAKIAQRRAVAQRSDINVKTLKVEIQRLLGHFRCASSLLYPPPSLSIVGEEKEKEKRRETAGVTQRTGTCLPSCLPVPPSSIIDAAICKAAALLSANRHSLQPSSLSAVSSPHDLGSEALTTRVAFRHLLPCLVSLCLPLLSPSPAPSLASLGVRSIETGENERGGVRAGSARRLSASSSSRGHRGGGKREKGERGEKLQSQRTTTNQSSGAFPISSLQKALVSGRGGEKEKHLKHGGLKSRHGGGHGISPSAFRGVSHRHADGGAGGSEDDAASVSGESEEEDEEEEEDGDEDEEGASVHAPPPSSGPHHLTARRAAAASRSGQGTHPSLTYGRGAGGAHSRWRRGGMKTAAEAGRRELEEEDNESHSAEEGDSNSKSVSTPRSLV